MELSTDQTQALDAIIKSPSDVMVMTGPAGSGKTFLMNKLGTAPGPWFAVDYIAPTGRAASRLRDSVNAPARTLHSALYGKATEEEAPVFSDDGQPVYDEDGNQKVKSTGRLLFGKPHAPCQPNTLLVCDEASMVSTDLYNDLLQHMPHNSKLLFVGDREQIPPVKGTWGPDFDNPTAVLTTIHRQAWDNPIIRLATAIRQEEYFDWDHESCDQLQLHNSTLLQASKWLAGRREDGVDATLITYTNKTRSKINDHVRKLLGLDEYILCNGDHIVCLFNNHGRGVMNGEVLIIENVVESGDHYLVKFVGQDLPFTVHPGLIGAKVGDFRDWAKRLKRRSSGEQKDDAKRMINELGISPVHLPVHDPFELTKVLAESALHVDYGQCLTVHKSQGSEWDEVGFIIDNGLRWSARKNPDFARRLKYTAVTRARDTLGVWQT